MAADELRWESDGDMLRAAATLHSEDDDFGQAHTLVREVFDDGARERLVETVSGSLSTVKEPVLSNAFQYWKNIDQEVGEAIERAVNTAKADSQPGGDPLDSETPAEQT